MFVVRLDDEAAESFVADCAHDTVAFGQWHGDVVEVLIAASEFADAEFGSVKGLGVYRAAIEAADTSGKLPGGRLSWEITSGFRMLTPAPVS